MRKIISLFFIIMLITISMATAFSINRGANVYFDCKNATTGDYLGTSASLTCYDSLANEDLSAEAMTNVAAGLFNYTFATLVSDTYACKIDCVAGAIDYVVPLQVGYISPNNLTDGVIRSTTIETGISSLNANMSAGIIANTSSINTNINSVLSGMITNYTSLSNSLNSILSGMITNTTAINSNVDSDTNVILTGMITNTTAILNGLSTNTSTLATKIDLLSTNESIQAKLDSVLSGMITNTTAINSNVDNVTKEVWVETTRTLTTADWTTDSDLVTLVNTIDARLNASHSEGNWSNREVTVDTSTISTQITSLNANVSAAIIANTTAITNAIKTNFSAVATEVWSYNTRKLTDFNFFVGLNETALTNIDARLNASHTGNWSAVTSVDISSLATKVDLLNTNESIHDKLDGISGDVLGVAADVWTYPSRYVNLTAAAIAAINAGLNVSGLNITCPTLNEIDTRLNLSHSSGNWSNGGNFTNIANATLFGFNVKTVCPPGMI